VAEAKTRLEALPATIAPIRSLEVGEDLVGSPASAHLCLITTHDDLDGLRAYQDHPDHHTFAQWLRPKLSARSVCDMEI
jgi:hypothetical protein